MTSLVLGVAGAVIGNFIAPGIGGSIGFLIGSLVGNLIDPPKSEGPRLNDLKLQVSTYGKVIPYVWGAGRLAGNAIDQTDLQEHKQKSGGKGGPEVTTYTYSSSFDLLLCVGPILGIRRIWADSRLIWDDNSGETIPCTVYLGSTDQLPDPTFEAIHGVGMVPGYRGYAHVVFTDYFLTDFGNRIPQLEFEVFTKVGTFPWRVSNFDPVPTGAVGTPYVVTYASGALTVAHYNGTTGEYHERQFDINGVEDTAAAYDAPIDGGANNIFPIANMLAAMWGTGGTFLYREHVATTAIVNPLGGPLNITNGEYQSGYIFTVCTSNVSGHVGVCRWPATNGVIDSTTGISDAVHDFGIIGGGPGQTSACVLGVSNRLNNVYVCIDHVTLYELDLDLVVVRQWDLTAVDAISPVMNGGGFTVYENSSGNIILACDRGIGGFKQAAAFYLNDDLTVTYIGAVNAISLTLAPITELGTSGYALVQDGVISLVPPIAAVPLSEIVADLTELTPLGGSSPAQYDVSELTDLVRWFAAASNMTVKNAISVLRPLYFFDAVESDDTVKFKKRGGAVIATIPDDDLCARVYGEQSGEPLRTIRKKEQGLPRTVTMTYYDVDADYQTGAQSSPRQVTLSQSDVTLDEPVGLTGDEALQKCLAIHTAEWVERETFEWSTTRKWAHLEPCDVVIVRGREIRILTRNESPKGVIQWTGVLSAPSLYTQSAPGGTGGFTPQLPNTTNSVATELVLLDIPILSQHDSPFGFYAAMGPALTGRWPGATLYKSLDDGVNWIAIASSNVASIIGLTSTSTGSPSGTGVLASYGGGEVVDESTIFVTLTDDDAQLESCTGLALENGANLCAISRGYEGSPAILKWELLQFRDATLVSGKTYELKGFKRARKGTSTTNHANGDQFVLLPVTNVDAPESELNLLLKYKAVTFGNTLASANSQDFINTGLSAEEYYDTEIIHLPVFGGDTGSPGGGTPGLVPGPAVGDCAAGKYLDACGGWSVPPGTSSGAGSPTPITANFWMFGSGGDSSAVLDGTNTFSWASKVGNVYTLVQLVSLITLQVNSGVTLLTNGFTIFVSSILTNNGTISCAGADAIGTNGGLGGGSVNSVYLKGTDGGSGGVANGVIGGAYTIPATGGGGVGGSGGAGGATTGGAGGLIPFPSGPPGFSPTTTFGQLSIIIVPLTSKLFNSLGSQIGGGSGGGSGGGANPQPGGGGGGGGGVLSIFANHIAGSGSITVKGGDGKAGGNNCGGGGGGGGGLMYITTTTLNYTSLNTVSVAGGSPGPGTGTGATGVAGTTGRLIEFFV